MLNRCSRRRRSNAPLPAFNECPIFRESGWYHGSFTPFVPILRGRKAFFITTVMDDTRRARRLGAPYKPYAHRYERRAGVVPQGTFSCPNRQFTLSHRTVKITDHCNSEVSSVISGPASCATYPCRTRAASAQGPLASQAPTLLLYQIPHLEKRAKSPK